MTRFVVRSWRGQERLRRRLALLLVVVVCFAVAETFAVGKDAADYAPLAAELDKLVEAELARGYLPGVSIALVDDQQTVLVKGYGLADRDRQIKATADTVYRAGSISKLFTAVAVMQ